MSTTYLRFRFAVFFNDDNDYKVDEVGSSAPSLATFLTSTSHAEPSLSSSSSTANVYSLTSQFAHGFSELCPSVM